MLKAITDQVRQKRFLQGGFGFGQLAFAVKEKIEGKKGARGPQSLRHGGKMAAILSIAVECQNYPLPLSEALIMQPGLF
jgi:hypothetical protein